MSLIQSSRPGGAGGGGIAIAGWEIQQLTQTTNFLPGAVNIPLDQQPATEKGIEVDYNGQKLLYNSEWSYDSGSNSVTILFGDPYVDTYDEPPVFQTQYPFI